MDRLFSLDRWRAGLHPRNMLDPSFLLCIAAIVLTKLGPPLGLPPGAISHGVWALVGALTVLAVQQHRARRRVVRAAPGGQG